MSKAASFYEKSIGENHYIAPVTEKDPSAPSLDSMVFAAVASIENNPISVTTEGQGHGLRYVFNVPHTEQVMSSTSTTANEYSPESYFAGHTIALFYNKKTASLQYTVPASTIHARDSRKISIPLIHYPNIAAAIKTHIESKRSANKEQLLSSLHAVPEHQLSKAA